MLTVVALASTATVTHQSVLAQTAAPPPVPTCHLITSAQSVPDGFGAAYNLFSAANELLLGVECGSSSNATLTVGDGQNTTHVYRFGYEWVDGAWKQINLDGSQLAGRDWYVGTAKANLVRSQTELAQDNFVVAYTCLWQNNAWKCGCRDTSCTQNYWQLQAFRQEAPTGSGSKIPAATRKVNVSNSSQLSSAINNAQPGDHIVLANGTYNGFTITRSGTASKPIVIRAANLQGAEVGNIDIEGDYVWVIGMDAGASITAIFGNYDRVSRNYYKNGRVHVRPSGPVGAEIDHNEFDGANVGWHHTVDPRSSCQSIDNFYIHHNYFHDNTDANKDAALVMNLGSSCDSDSRVEYNLVTNWAGNHGIYDKGGGTTYAFNTVLRSKGISNRGFSRITPNNTVVGSTRNEWIANWIEGGMLIHGADNRIIGNRVVTGSIHLGCGNWEPGEAPDDTSKHLGFVAATNNLVAGNIGALTVGVQWATICAGTAGYGGKNDIFPAKNNKIQAHQGAVEYGKHVGTQVSQTSSVSVPTAFKLTPSQVGPNAPTAPSL